MFNKLSSLLRKVMNELSMQDQPDPLSMDLAMASLLCEVANADHDNDPREEEAKINLLIKLLDMDRSSAEKVLAEANIHSKNAISLYEFTSRLRKLEQKDRYDLIFAMWQVAYADGVIDPMEEAVIRQVAELLYLDHSDFIKAKLLAEQEAMSSL